MPGVGGLPLSRRGKGLPSALASAGLAWAALTLSSPAAVLRTQQPHLGRERQFGRPRSPPEHAHVAGLELVRREAVTAGSSAQMMHYDKCPERGPKCGGGWCFRSLPSHPLSDYHIAFIATRATDRFLSGRRPLFQRHLVADGRVFWARCTRFAPTQEAGGWMWVVHIFSMTRVLLYLT